MNLSLDCLVLFLVLLSTKELWNHFNEQSQRASRLPPHRRLGGVKGVSVSASVACVPIASAKVRRFTAPRKKIHEKSGCFCKNRSLFRISTLQTKQKEAVFGDFQGIFRPSRSLSEEKRGGDCPKTILSNTEILQSASLRMTLTFEMVCFWQQQGQQGQLFLMLSWLPFYLTTTGTTSDNLIFLLSMLS